MPTVIGANKGEFDRHEMQKKGLVTKSAIEHIAKETGGRWEHIGYDEDLGHQGILHHKDAQVQLSVKETPKEVYLNNIATKDPNDLTKEKHGTGRGDAAVNALKHYSDQSKKKMVVFDATEPGKKYWDKKEWLKHEKVTSTVDGEKYTPEHSYTYTPNANKPKEQQ